MNFAFTPVSIIISGKTKLRRQNVVLEIDGGDVVELGVDVDAESVDGV